VKQSAQHTAEVTRKRDLPVEYGAGGDGKLKSKTKRSCRADKKKTSGSETVPQLKVQDYSQHTVHRSVKGEGGYYRGETDP